MGNAQIVGLSDPLQKHLYACILGFRRTLEIITRTLCEVVNRVRLCGHHTRKRSRGDNMCMVRGCGDGEVCRLMLYGLLTKDPRVKRPANGFMKPPPTVT